MKLVCFSGKDISEKDIVEAVTMFQYQDEYTLEFNARLGELAIMVADNITIDMDYVEGYFWGICDALAFVKKNQDA